jgi:chlorinating enzyme
MSDKNWEIETTVTDEQVAFYNENGYLKFGRIFTKSELDELRDYVDGMIAALPEGKRPEQMDVPHFEHPYLFKYLTHPRVLDVIEWFIGPDIALWSSHFISKRTSDGLAVPWHQDGVYWGDRLQPMHVITMWLAVDESTVENGCMRVISGSHKLRDRRYENVDTKKNLFGREVVAEDLDLPKAVDLELKVGECHFHDAFTIHGSNPNTSQKRRCGYTMRYMPANVRFNGVSWNRKHHIYLARGKDQTDGYNQYTPVPAF